MAISAVVVAVGAVAGAAVKSNGARDAAETQANAANQASTTENTAAQQANTIQQQEFNAQQKNLAPYMAAGQTALANLQAGIQPGGAYNTPFTMADFQNSAGYNFIQQQGDSAISARNAAGGQGTNPAATEALINYNQGLASTSYQQQFTNYMTQQNNAYTQQENMLNMGVAATNNDNSLGGVNAQVQGGNLTKTASEVGSNQIGAGNATAAGQVASANATAGALSTITSAVAGGGGTTGSLGGGGSGSGTIPYNNIGGSSGGQGFNASGQTGSTGLGGGQGGDFSIGQMQNGQGFNASGQPGSTGLGAGLLSLED